MPINGLLRQTRGCERWKITASCPLPTQRFSSYLKNHASDARAFHAHLLRLGCLLSSVFLCNNLVLAYVARRMVGDARKLFDEMPERNDFSWSMMISGYAQLGYLRDAATLFGRMRGCREEAYGGDGSLPVMLVFGSVLRGCTQARDLGAGVQFHCSAMKIGAVSDTFVASTLVDMYGKCGEVEESWKAFKQSTERDVVTWTTIVSRLAKHERQEFRDAAFGLFRDMIRSGVRPVDMTITSLVKTFDGPDKLSLAKQVHGCIMKFGIQVDDLLGSALIAMYGKCGGLNEAVRLSAGLPEMDAVSWTSLLMGYVQNGSGAEAIDVFRKIVREKVSIDPYVIACVLGACSEMGDLVGGKEIHGYTLRHDLLSDISVANAIITLYGRCHEAPKAEVLFRMMDSKDDISWTALLNCYGQNGLGERTISLFLEMLREGLSPSPFCIVGVVRSCSTILSLCLGEQMHSRVVRMGCDRELSVENSLITMYGKCGNVNGAATVFRSMITRDVISWNAMIAAFSQNGLEKDALTLFQDMQSQGIGPNDYTFLGVLVACSHAGKVDEGCQYFNSMTAVYGVDPKEEHYACMVSLYGRAGRLRDAVEFIEAMPSCPDRVVWEALLTACMLNGNTDLGKLAAEKILQITPDNPAVYSIMSNLHASMGMWDLKSHILTTMKNRGVRKEPSKSWLEIKGSVHVFSADDRSHPHIHLIHQKLEELRVKMVKMGYVPRTEFVMQDIEDDQKELSLLHHSEKLAVAFALIAAATGTPIRIMQNLRCCGDCHAALELISLIEDRHIVLQDAKRFHHFIKGCCSCNKDCL